jgi:hypothetical protein
MLVYCTASNKLTTSANLALMHDASKELAELSLEIQKRSITLVNKFLGTFCFLQIFLVKQVDFNTLNTNMLL